MNKKEIIKNAFWSAVATASYILAISSLLFNSKFLFEHAEPSIFIPVMMLSLLVFSAALTGSLIFGQPILWYWDGKKREAIALFASTLLFFLLFTIVMVLINATA